MAQLNVRLDEHTRESFDALARGRGVTSSDLVRDLVNQALGRGVADVASPDPAPRSMTAVERRTLSLQHEMMSMLSTDPDEVEHNQKMMSVLNEGFVSEYSDLFAPMQPELPRRECELLNDIFQMFRMLELSLDALSADDRAALGQHAEHALTFRGFDFNDSREGRLATYAEYLVNDRRWEERAGDFDGEPDSGNSHMPMLDTYQRMLSVWRPLWDKKVRSLGGRRELLFTPEELREIIAAWVHPEHRDAA